MDVGTVVAAFLFGVRHGFDWDHLAAIADITTTQRTPKRALWFATLYAGGHALVVLGLGVVAVAFSDLLPKGWDAAMGRVVGATLLALGVYVLYTLVRDGSAVRLRSRSMLLVAALRRALAAVRPSMPVEIDHEHDHPVGDEHGHSHADEAGADGAEAAVAVRTRTHSHRHRHIVAMPPDPFRSYGGRASFGVGMVHGIGAETPTQVLLFLAAAGVGAMGGGLVLLGVFIAGLFVSNTVIAVASAVAVTRAADTARVYVALALVTGVFSVVVGARAIVG